MAFKPKFWHVVVWVVLSLLGLAVIAVVAIPPMITLNNMKPRLEAAIAEQTGIEAKINGDINFSLLGHATIVAHDIAVPNGTVKTVVFQIPLRYIFDLSAAPVAGTISIRGANVTAAKLVPMGIKNRINISDSVVSFLGKDYTIIDGVLFGASFNGRVRTDQHKYEINYAGENFYVANKTNELVIIGRMTANGGARGTMSFNTANINRLFEFDAPVVRRRVSATMKFDWNGEYGFHFTDIRGDNFTGNITLYPSGARDIELKSDNISFDFSFLLQPSSILYKTKYNLDLYGQLMLSDHEFKHLQIVADGSVSELKIEKIVADNWSLYGGTVDANGAHNIMLSMPMGGKIASCLFSGTPEKWECRAFSYDDMRGKITVAGDEFDITVSSDKNMPGDEDFRLMLKDIGRRGTINFNFADAAGTMQVTPKSITAEYTFARGRNLSWQNMDWYFLPQFMKDATGDFSWNGTAVTFRPVSGDWMLSADGAAFVITGHSIKAWLPNLDLRAVRDAEYQISGRQKSGAISDLHINIAGHDFTGSVSGDAITLNTNVLNLDSFVSQDFVDNYDEMEFLADLPLMIPFGVRAKVSLSADKIIYNGDEFSNFVYSLKPDAQTYSITDDARGNLLATIRKNKSAYDIFVQLNKFVTRGPILSVDMPLNVRDSVITADINMKTNGQIAHDIKHNLTGDIDMTLSGGTIIGMGIDEFYAGAQNITTLNAEFALARALDGGETRLKEMHIMGHYAGGDFKTTTPISLYMRHTDGAGKIEVKDGKMYATFNLILRGTSPSPQPITLNVLPTGKRQYSLSEIMTNFDAGFLREFVKTHNKF